MNRQEQEKLWSEVRRLEQAVERLQEIVNGLLEKHTYTPRKYRKRDESRKARL